MSERLEYFNLDTLAFRYTCECGKVEFVIKVGTTLPTGDHETLCPVCHADLKDLRDALSKWQQFREETKKIEEARKKTNKIGPLLRFQVVLPEDYGKASDVTPMSQKTVTG